MMDTTLTSTTVVGTLSCVNFGPVTSIYTPHTSCYSTTSFILQNFNIYTESDCLPYGVLDYTTRFQYYSPGICPRGYNSASSIPNLPTATTASFCCPSSLTLNTAQRCESRLSSGQTLTSVQLQQTAGSGFSVVSSSVLSEANIIFAPAILVAWEASDTAIGSLLASLASSTSSSRVTASPTHLGSSVSPTSPPPLLSSAPTAQSGITAGVKAGIAVGSILVFVAITVAIFFYFRHQGQRQKQQQNGARRGDHELATVFNAHELPAERNLLEMDAQDKGALVSIHEKDGRAMEYNPNIHEADATAPQGRGVV